MRRPTLKRLRSALHGWALVLGIVRPERLTPLQRQTRRWTRDAVRRWTADLTFVAGEQWPHKIGTTLRVRLPGDWRPHIRTNGEGWMR